MSLSKSSIQKLRKLKAAILAEPELYDQGQFPQIGHSCNTPCCIAGWAVWIANPNSHDYEKKLYSAYSFGSAEMAEALGITRYQASLLYSGWPDHDVPAWNEPCTKAGAISGAKRIDLFIESGGEL